MIDINIIRENPELVKSAIKNKSMNVDIDRILQLDEQRRKFTNVVDELRAKRNKSSKEIQNLAPQEREAKVLEVKNMKTELEENEKQLQAIIDEQNKLLLYVPSIPSDEAPIGKDENDNVEIRKWGEVPTFNFKPYDHVEIGEALDILDIPRGVKVAGSRNYYLKNEGVLLESAVLQFSLHHLIKKGYTPFSVPFMVRDEAMYGTGYYPGGEEQAYKIDKDGLNLIGTSEVPLVSYHSEEMLNEKDLPKRYCSLSTCFRREAGTYGKDTKGIYRIHQFQKVEQVIICKNDKDESKKFHDELQLNSEEILQALKLPYRVVKVCTGEMGIGQVFKYDIETFMPSRNSYGETHSCSMFYDFQARRSMIRYKDKDGAIHFVHTLNNTAIASPRILIPILEIYQQENGSVIVPEVLRPFMGGVEVIKPRKMFNPKTK